MNKQKLMPKIRDNHFIGVLLSNSRKHKEAKIKVRSEQTCHNHYRRPRGEICYYKFDPQRQFEATGSN